MGIIYNNITNLVIMHLIDTLDFLSSRSDKLFMNYFMRNNNDDFQRWFRHIVPFAMFELEQFKHGKNIIVFRDDYDDAITVHG